MTLMTLAQMVARSERILNFVKTVRWLQPFGPSIGSFGDWRTPVRRGYFVIGITVGAMTLWSTTARLDSAVVASGSIVVESSRKAVQHLEGGIVESISAKDGMNVHSGDVLLRLDVTQATAQLGIAQLGVMQALGEEARFVAQADRLDRVTFPQEMTSRIDVKEALRTMLDQDRQFKDRESARRVEISILNERLTQSVKQFEATQSQRNATVTQAASLADELEKLRPLADKGYVTASRINPLQRSLTDLQGKVGSLEADMARLAMAKEEVRLQVDQVDRKYTEEASSKLADSRLRLAEAREKLRVAQDVLARTEIRAPRAGRVVGSNVHTIGAVIKPGETVMEIVPNDDLVVAAKVSPIDVTHVHPGMAAEVRLPAFKSRTTPVTMGEITSIGADALLNDVTHQTSYELRVSIRASDLPPQLREALRPGMPAQVFISTGERTVIAYLTQPLFDTLRSGLREE